MPVAQPDRVFGYEPKGQGFESLQARQRKASKLLKFRGFCYMRFGRGVLLFLGLFLGLLGWKWAYLAFKMASAARSAVEASRALNATPRLPGCTVSCTIRTRPPSGFGDSIYLTKYKKRAIMGMVEEATQHGRIQGEGKYPGEE